VAILPAERPVQASAALISVSRLLFVLGCALVVAMGALGAAQASGAPRPDPYRPTTVQQAPAPDPDPSAKTSAPALVHTPSPEPEPAPVASTPRSSSSGAVRRQPTRTTPRKHVSASVTNQVKGLKKATASPRTAPEQRLGPIAAPEVTTTTASTSGRPLALAGLALFALAVASGSLLYVLLPADARRAGV
jgi:hypothetical protein